MSQDSRARTLIGASLIAGLLLVVVYVAAGGASYSPTEVQNPCEPREWRDPGGVEELAEQFSLSALDGAACELRVTREELARSLGTEADRRDFIRRYGIDDATLEAAVRAGLVRAIDDAEAAGAVPPLLAGPLREFAQQIPVDEAIALLEDSRRLFEGAGGLLGQLGGIAGEVEGLIPRDLRELAP